jgi:hypothetical protein
MLNLEPRPSLGVPVLSRHLDFFSAAGGMAGKHGLHLFLRTAAIPLVGDDYCHAVVGLQRVLGVHVDHAVSPDGVPISSCSPQLAEDVVRVSMVFGLCKT